MKKIVTVLLVLFTLTFGYGTTLKEIVDNPINSLELNYRIIESVDKYDYDNIENLKFHIPLFNDDYSFNKFYFQFRDTKEISELKAQLSEMTKAWESTNKIQSTQYDFGMTELDYSKSLENYTSKDIFLLPMSSDGYHMLNAWSGGKKPMILFSLTLDGLDLTNEKDILLIYKIIIYNLEVQSRSVSSELSGKGIKSLNEIKQDPQGIIQYNERQQKVKTNIFVEYCTNSTLLFPEEEKTKKIEEIFDNQWKFSKVIFKPQSEINQIIKKGVKGFYYFKTQNYQSSKKINKVLNMSISQFWFLSTYTGEVVNVATSMSPNLKEIPIEESLTQIVTRINMARTNSWITYNKHDFDFNSLPEDLRTSKVYFTNITRAEKREAHWINKSFKNRFEEYPYEIKIINAADKINPENFDYTIKLSFESFLEQKNNGEIIIGHLDSPFKARTVIVTKYKVYLEHNKSGETYCIQNESLEFDTAFKNLIQAINKE